MLERILRNKFKISDLKPELDELNSKDLINYLNDKVKANWDSISGRVYDLRCAIVHSKAKGKKILPYSHEEFTVIPAHLPLLDKICLKLINETDSKSVRVFGV